MPAKIMFKLSPFLRHNIVFFLGTFIAAALNYLFYPVVGRLMNVSQFGETQVLVSMYTQITVLFTVTVIVIANIVTNTVDQSARYAAISQLQHLLMLAVAIGGAIVMLSAQVIRDYFHFESILPLYGLVVAVVVTMPLTVRVGMLRGDQRFGSAVFSGILSALFKLIASVVLVLVGLQTFGVLAGIALSQIVALLYTQWRVKKAGLPALPINVLKMPRLESIAPHLKYAAFVLFITLIITLQFSLDVVIIKRLFDPDTAGLYAGVATVARIIFFITSSVSAVLFSSVHVQKPLNDNLHLLMRSVIMLLALGGIPLSLFVFYPEWTVSILMGSKYTTLTSLLPILGVTIFIISLSNMIVTFCMALRWYFVLIPTLIGGIVTFLLIFLRHQNVEQVVQSFLWGSICLLVLAALNTAWKVLPAYTRFSQAHYEK